MDFLVYLVIAGLACSYLVKVLLLEQKISHEGPFVLETTFVFFEDTKHVQRFTLFDIIRFIFGAYKRMPGMSGQRIFSPRDHWLAEIWTCPLCLSFWIALPFTALLYFSFHPPAYFIPQIHFAIAFISYRAQV